MQCQQAVKSGIWNLGSEGSGSQIKGRAGRGVGSRNFLRELQCRETVPGVGTRDLTANHKSSRIICSKGVQSSSISTRCANALFYFQYIRNWPSNVEGSQAFTLELDQRRPSQTEAGSCSRGEDLARSFSTFAKSSSH